MLWSFVNYTEGSLTSGRKMLRYRRAIVSENGFLAFPSVDARSKWVAHLNNMLIPVSDYGIGVTDTFISWCGGSCDQSLFRWLYVYHGDKAVSSEMPAITSFLQVYDANSISCDREWIFLHSRFISFALWLWPCAFSRSPICRPVADRRRDNNINPILTRVFARPILPDDTTILYLTVIP